MPIFEYYCEKCDETTEAIQSQRERDKGLCCEKCGNELEKVVGKGIGFKFKGTGFYCTDYITKKNGDIH